MARDQMREVVLVEVVDPDPDELARGQGPDEPVTHDAAAPRASFPEPIRRRALRGPRRWWAVAAGLTLLLTGGVLSSLHTQERAARLAAQPDVLASVTPHLNALWEEPLRGWGQVASIGRDIVLFGYEPERRSAAVVVLDAITGKRRWASPLPEVDWTGNVDCVALGSTSVERAPNVACVLVASTRSDAQDGKFAAVAPAMLVILDGATGARTVERALETDKVSVAALGNDVVLAQVLRDGHVSVSRLDARTGRARWAFRSPAPLPMSRTGEPWVSVEIQHGVIVVSAPVSWAMTQAGRLLGEWHLVGGDRAAAGGWALEVSVLPNARFAVGQSGGSWSSQASYGTVSQTDRRDGFEIPGPVLVPLIDDSSAADVLFVRPVNHSGIVALDAATGELRWRSDWTPGSRVLVLDGRVIGLERHTLMAIDAHSGGVLWKRDVPVGNPQQVLTDGRLLLVPMFDTVRGPMVAAFNAAEGRQEWARALPQRVTYLNVLQRRLLGMSDRQLVGLG
ncbi:PQQ-binding-like beta-propeller repeat protein [Pengzhenrongella sp.]|jgi:outer membrane protein assembly factor BamB|uniref:outer membrane protein assembly factor BamB family protein n=1 Tax=Pengzhenrongella sp. TaxID=2888820 RepID=UPI002F91CAF9